MSTAAEPARPPPAPPPIVYVITTLGPSDEPGFVVQAVLPGTEHS